MTFYFQVLNHLLRVIYDKLQKKVLITSWSTLCHVHILRPFCHNFFLAKKFLFLLLKLSQKNFVTKQIYNFAIFCRLKLLQKKILFFFTKVCFCHRLLLWLVKFVPDCVLSFHPEQRKMSLCSKFNIH